MTTKNKTEEDKLDSDEEYNEPDTEPSDEDVQGEISDAEDDEEVDQEFSHMSIGHFQRFVLDRVHKRNTNYNMVFLGEPGSGKSWAGLRMASKLNPNFVKNPIVVFSVQDYLLMIKNNKVKRGDVIIFDEVGVAVNKKLWWSVINRAANLTFQTVRNKNFITIFTTPFPDYVDSDTRKLFQVFFKYKKSFDKSQLRSFSAYKIKFNDFYHKYMYSRYKFSVSGETWELNEVLFKKPKASLIRIYEQLKKEFQVNLYKTVFDEVIKATTNDSEQWKLKVDSLLPDVERDLDAFLIRDTKGKEKVDPSLIRARHGEQLQVCQAVSTILEKKYSLGRYSIM
ncbi:MAG: ATP-binding protein [Candidatus Moranbacteria bacterium]|nr:ATP-binding protein [Candidatus Moranbacteria bacterium]